MIRLVLSDLDGTLITSHRELTAATLRAVGALRSAGIEFTIVSGRPPLGMRFIVRELGLRAPFAAFNGGMLIQADPKTSNLTVLEELLLDPEVTAAMIRRLDEMGLDTWLYRGQEWLVRHPEAPHVARERANVRINPTVVASFDQQHDGVVKIVGVSDDYRLVARAEQALREDRCHIVMAARSQNYYLDVTHPDANKGRVVRRLAAIHGISPAEIATLGDMPSDVRMFEQSGISFAMGNASDSVKAKATQVIASNDGDGFSEAVEVLLKKKIELTRSAPLTKEKRAISPLIELHDRYGQSPWLDSIQRELISSGQLRNLVSQHGLRGLTSNPSLFDKAITESNAYDEQLEKILGQGDRDVKQIYEELAIADIRGAADVLRTVYDSSRGRDGFASLEVAPTLARDTEGTVEEARRLWSQVSRPNVMIKVPATNEGIPAIRRLIADGINVNVTLLFSREMYREIANAYLDGLEERATRGKPIDRIASVASFFVSRIDTLVDQRLAALNDPRALELKGKIAVANAKLAYVHFREVIESPRWKKLAAGGAQAQRLLWASTSTKNPAYRDVVYVEALIGPDTVNTMPPATMKAFEDHGVLRASLAEGINEAKVTLKRLADVNISLHVITNELTEEGIRLFAEPFAALMANLERKKRRIGRNLNPQSLRLPAAEMIQVGEALRDWGTHSKVRRLWARDSLLWTGHDEARWLGWLSAARDSATRIESGRQHRSRWAECAGTSVGEVVLLGMGGSSMAPEVFAMTFDPAADRPDLHVLDSTSPEQIAKLEKQVDPARAFFIVSSKSGTTLEPNIFLDYFYDKVRGTLGENAGKRFIAITDPGSELERVAKEKGFFAVFHGNPEIGGRYSALSAFGLVPAAVMGVDVKRFLRRTDQMVNACSANVPPEENPGVILGATLGALGKAGRDKVTLICSPEIGDLAAWLEQLLAESTGKSGKGLIPIADEPIGGPESYGDDRLFVYLRLRDGQSSEVDRAVDVLEDYGHPVVRIEVESAYTLGQEFFRWEMATAVAGAILGINPFDQPDVEAAKVETRKLTSEIERRGSLPEPEESPVLVEQTSLVDILREYLGRIHPRDYFALLAYVEMSPANEEILQEIREMVRRARHVATCLGFGPRYLHSTGQAYKGGPNCGVFLQITSDHGVDLPIPGHAYSFGQVQDSQARGDLQVLTARNQRCLRVHLPPDQAAGLAKLREAVRAALSSPSEAKGVAA